MEQALIRVPALETTGIRKFYNGPESFTPDNQFLLGEVPGLRGFFVGAGFNSVGIASAGGAGRALAEWIVEGSPTSDLVGVDVRRFAPYAADNDWLRSRVAEVLGLHYEIPWPLREPVTARGVRTSPLHERLAEHGAHNGSRMGWERPLYFVPSGERDGYDAEAADRTWTKPAWLPWSAAEQRATREAVAVFDQTSFSKYVVTGPGALEAPAVDLRGRRGRPGRPLRLHAVPQRASHLRGRPHGDARRATRSSGWSAAPRRPCVTSTGWAGTLSTGWVRRPRRGPHRRVLGDRRDGAALA